MDNAYKRFAKAKQEMPSPVRDVKADIKTKQGKDFSYSYADLAQIRSIVDPVLWKHDLDVLQFQDNGLLHTRILDLANGGESFIEDTRKLSDGEDRARGSSETYQRRYALLTVCGLSPEDDDGAAASKPTPAPVDNELIKSRERMWQAVGKDKSVAELITGVEHPETPEWYDAVGMLWVTIVKYQQQHGGDCKKLFSGVRDRKEYEETAAFYVMVRQEFESEIS